MIFGTFKPRLVSSSTDAVGVTTHTVTQCYARGEAAPSAETLLKAIGVTKAAYDGGSDEQLAGGLMKHTARFKCGVALGQSGGGDGGRTVSPGAAAAREVITLGVQLIEAPIATHPMINTLISIYGGKKVDGVVTFPSAEMPKAGGGGTTNSGTAEGGGGASEGRPNPLFGVTTYKVASKVATKKYVIKGDSPPEFGNHTGKICNPGAAISATAPGEEWMCLSVNANPLGDIYEVEETYISSGPAGFNKHLWSYAR